MENHQRAILQLRRAQSDHPIIARYGRGAIKGLARVAQLFTSVDATHMVDQGEDLLNTAEGSDPAVERMLTEGLLDVCREFPDLARRVQNAQRKRGSGLSGGAGSDGDETPDGLDVQTLENQRAEGERAALACGASSSAAPPREPKREEPALSQARPRTREGFIANRAPVHLSPELRE